MNSDQRLFGAQSAAPTLSATGEPHAIEISNLKKGYDGVEALTGFNLVVPQGRVFALLGPNGAGKTTVVRILSTLVQPDAGYARVKGHDVVTQARAVRRVISLTGQFTALDEMATGRENLVLFGRLAGLSTHNARLRSDQLAEQLEFTEVFQRRVHTYSGGTRRRLDLAAGLMLRPSVLFLDEPTTGLDLRGRHAIWSTVADLALRGVTVFLTTQYLEEADRVADVIGIIDRGHLVAHGTPRELKQAVGGQRLHLVANDAPALEMISSRLETPALRVDVPRLSVVTPTDGSAPSVRRLLDQIDPDRTLLARFNVEDARLDDVFLATVSKSSSP